MEIIKRKIEQVRRRLRLLILLDELVIGLLVSAFVICVYMSVDKFVHWMWEPWQVICLLVGLGLFTGILLFLRRKVTAFDAAICIDERMQLKERISSALEFSDQSDKSPLIPKLVEDAVSHAEKVDPKNMLPLRPPKYFLYLTGLAVLAVILGFVPYYHNEQRQTEITTIKTLKQEGKKLEDLSKKIATESKGQNTNELKNVAKKLEDVGKALQQPKINEKEALAKLAKLTEELRKTQEKMPMEKGMQEAMKNLAKANNGDLGKLGESLKQGKMDAAQAQLDELKKKLERGEISKNEMQEMAKDLKKMQGSMKGSGMDSLGKSLGDMAKAMAAGDLKGAEASAELSKKEMDELKKAFKEAEKMAQAIDAAEGAKKKVAGAGQAGDGGGDGEGDGEGGSGGKGQGQGKGKRMVRILAYGQGGNGPDAGKTSTNLDEGGNGVAQKRSEFYNRQSKETNDRTGDYVKLYDPKYVDNKTYDTRVKGKLGEGQMAEIGETEGKPTPTKGYVPYSEIYKDSKQQAEDAMDKEEVPAGYKDYVKNYFESIDPKKENTK